MLSAHRLELVMKGVLWLTASVVLIIPVMMAYDLMINGFSTLSLEFLVSEPQNSGRAGGIGPLIISTGLILFVCLSVVIPLGITCALYLSESVEESSASGKRISLVLDILSGVPSIIFGLFGYVFFAQVLGFGFSILSGGLTLACMALPLFVR